MRWVCIKCVTSVSEKLTKAPLKVESEKKRPERWQANTDRITTLISDQPKTKNQERYGKT
jgi:phage portal protein BeeE